MLGISICVYVLGVKSKCLKSVSRSLDLSAENLWNRLVEKWYFGGRWGLTPSVFGYVSLWILEP